MPEERKLTILFATGLRINVTPKELASIMLDPIVVTFFLSLGVVFGYVVPQEGYYTISALEYFLSALTLSVIVLFALHILFAFFYLIFYNIPGMTMVSSVVLVFVALCAEVTWHPVASFYSGATYLAGEGFWHGFATKILGVLGGELLYATFILQRTRWWQTSYLQNGNLDEYVGERDAAEFIPSTIKEPQPDPFFLPFITIGNDRILTGSLLFAQAERQYVRIIMEDRVLFKRMAFHSFLDMIPSGIGAQVHRSYWVAFSAVERFELTATGLGVVILKGDIRVPVSRRFGKSLPSITSAYMETNSAPK